MENFDQAKITGTLDWPFVMLLVGFVMFSYLMQWFLSKATLLRPASYIMPFGYIGIVVSAISDVIMFGEHFDWVSIVGMIMASGGLLVKLIVEEK
jgi:drug/metabolite transporter (DMT)-like permease